jgi:hypothetical protein
MEVLTQLEDIAQTRYVSRYHRAVAWTGAGDLDKAFALLACACDERDPALMLLQAEPRFAPVRDDSRYAGLAARLGFDREITANV